MTGKRSALYPRGPLGRCPSGQRELAVNQSALPTEVQILPGPPWETPRREAGRLASQPERLPQEVELQEEEVLGDLLLVRHVGDTGERQHLVGPTGL